MSKFKSDYEFRLFQTEDYHSPDGRITVELGIGHNYPGLSIRDVYKQNPDLFKLIYDFQINISECLKYCKCNEKGREKDA